MAASKQISMQTQLQMYYGAERRAAELNLLFLELVKDGLTKEELKRNIERRPQLWGRFESWLEKLPSKQMTRVALANELAALDGDSEVVQMSEADIFEHEEDAPRHQSYRPRA